MGSGQPRRPSPKRGYGLIVYTVLVANGSVGPLYVETMNAKFPLDLFSSSDMHIEYISKKAAGRGELGMCKFLDHAFKNKTLQRGDIGKFVFIFGKPPKILQC